MTDEFVERFKNIFVVEPSHDISPLSKHSNNLKVITVGNESVADLYDVIIKSLETFDPSTDALIPMGRNTANLITGVILSKLFPGREITIGIYNQGSYIFLEGNGNV